jgi:hypothetical protein
MTPLGWASVVLALVITWSAVDALLGLRRLGRLALADPIAGPAPRVSIVVAARNEARGVEAGMRSLLAQQYAALEIVAVNDRSTDETGAILDRLAMGEPRLRVVHVADLPPGWLGKNHALSLGAAAASGAWLLFTDADVVMQPDTLSRAIGHAERTGLDHLTVLPDLILPGLLKCFTVGFVVWFSAYVRPWKASDPRSRFFVGVGAFNLVRTTAYQRAGGHEPIRMRPDDDLKLGKILKRSGARAEAMSGLGMISVEWYHSLQGAIDGLMKNTFSVVEYYSALMLGGACFYLLVGFGPMAMLALGSGPVAVCGGVTIVSQLLVHTTAARETNAPWYAGALYPVAALLMSWILIRALALNLWQGGIVWRGTFYPLAELRKNRV